MKVCLVAEGCYPYVVGGVSGWINSLIKSFPNIEFILLAIVANRSQRGKFVYELPENLTQVYELYLDDCEWDEGRKMRKRLIIGMSGASGAPLTIELLKQLQQYKEIIETHLIVTKGAEMTLEQETDYTLEQLYALADEVHD